MRRSRARAESSPSAVRSLQRHRSDWPDPRYRHEAHRLFVLAGAGVHILLQSAYLLVETSNLLKQKAGQLADLLR